MATTSLSSCCWFSSQPASAVPPMAPQINFDSVRLQRLGCISGGCPVYTVTITGDGEVHYHGDAGVAVRGDRDAQADSKDLQQLRELLLNADVFWLQPRYTPGHANCGAWSMNDAAVTLDIQAQRLHKHIDHYLGCHSAPRLLTQIENAIDRTAEVRRWTRPH